jgi:hypothetical protein
MYELRLNPVFWGEEEPTEPESVSVADVDDFLAAMAWI